MKNSCRAEICFKDWLISFSVPLGLLALAALVILTALVGSRVDGSWDEQKKHQQSLIEVINHDKVYEGVVVEGPTYLANQQIAVVGVEFEVDGYKVIKPALVPIYDQHTWNNLVHAKELKLKVKIKGADIQAKGELPFFVWVVQQ